MNIVILQVFVSLMLVAGSVVLFVFSARQRDFDHADRLSLAPLETDPPRAGAARVDEAGPKPAPPPAPSADPGKETCTPNASNTTTP